MKRLMLLAVMMCSTGTSATNMYWSPTTFEDGTPAVIYLTDELSNACPSGGLWYRAYAINKKTHKTNRDSLCWTMASGSIQLANSATGVTEYLSPVGIIQGLTNEQIAKFNARLQAAMTKHAEQIQKTISEEMPQPKPKTQAEIQSEKDYDLFEQRLKEIGRRRSGGDYSDSVN